MEQVLGNSSVILSVLLAVVMGFGLVVGMVDKIKQKTGSKGWWTRFTAVVVSVLLSFLIGAADGVLTETSFNFNNAMSTFTIMLALSQTTYALIEQKIIVASVAAYLNDNTKSA